MKLVTEHEINQQLQNNGLVKRGDSSENLKNKLGFNTFRNYGLIVQRQHSSVLQTWPVFLWRVTTSNSLSVNQLLCWAHYMSHFERLSALTK